MDINPINFLLAKQAIDYARDGLGVKFSEDFPEYECHVFNLAMMMGLNTGSEKLQEFRLKNEKRFIKTMQEFEPTYWKITRSSKA